MEACRKGHIDTARMLLGEFHVNIEIQNKVRAIVRLVLCGDVRACVKWVCAWSWWLGIYFLISYAISCFWYIYISYSGLCNFFALMCVFGSLMLSVVDVLVVL